MKPKADRSLKIVTARLIAATTRVEGDCLVWTGARSPYGYGQCGTACRGVHRRSYEIFIGPIPPGMFVLHTCDNPPCVNPMHLVLGTPRDNMRDMVKKGRKKTGQHRRHGRPHLKPADVLAIRAEPLQIGPKILGEKYGVDRQTIRQIRQRKTWANL